MSDETGTTPDQKKDREKKEEDKALDTLTNVVEEKELDANKVKKALAEMAAAQQQDREAQRLREKELAAVKVNPADIDIFASEFELDKKTAERRLREHRGDLRAALEAAYSTEEKQAAQELTPATDRACSFWELRLLTGSSVQSLPERHY